MLNLFIYTFNLQYFFIMYFCKQMLKKTQNIKSTIFQKCVMPTVLMKMYYKERKVHAMRILSNEDFET